MKYLTPGDLKSHLYEEIIEEIVRTDESIVQSHIDAAVNEAKSYLNRYNIVALFGTNETAPTFTDPVLVSKVKDMAVWNLLTLASPNISLELYSKRNDAAVKWFRMIMEGDVDPHNWPLAADDPATPENEAIGGVTWNSNTKRSNHY